MRTPHALWLAVILLLAACGGSADQKTDNGTDLVIGDEGAVEPTSLFQMPTPNELFVLVREMAGEGQKRMMNPASNADRYAGIGKRAVNFGIYSTDLIYASYFDLDVEVVRYYLTVKELGEELGLTAAFNESDFVRLEANITRGNSDSIQVLSNEAYYKAYQKLQDEKMGATLALVLAGGWVESMHLVNMQIAQFRADDPLVARMAEQKFTLEHLVEMMEPYKDDPNVAPVREELAKIRAIYDEVAVTRSASKGASSSGRMVLGDEVKVEMTEADYTVLSKAVEMLRSDLIATETPAKVATNT